MHMPLYKFKFVAVVAVVCAVAGTLIPLTEAQRQSKMQAGKGAVSRGGNQRLKDKATGANNALPMRNSQRSTNQMERDRIGPHKPANKPTPKEKSNPKPSKMNANNNKQSASNKKTLSNPNSEKREPQITNKNKIGGNKKLPSSLTLTNTNAKSMRNGNNAPGAGLGAKRKNYLPEQNSNENSRSPNDNEKLNTNKNLNKKPNPMDPLPKPLPLNRQQPQPMKNSMQTLPASNSKNTTPLLNTNHHSTPELANLLPSMPIISTEVPTSLAATNVQLPEFPKSISKPNSAAFIVPRTPQPNQHEDVSQAFKSVQQNQGVSQELLFLQANPSASLNNRLEQPFPQITNLRKDFVRESVSANGSPHYSSKSNSNEALHNFLPVIAGKIESAYKRIQPGPINYPSLKFTEMPKVGINLENEFMQNKDPRSQGIFEVPTNDLVTDSMDYTDDDAFIYERNEEREYDDGNSLQSYPQEYGYHESIDEFQGEVGNVDYSYSDNSQYENENSKLQHAMIKQGEGYVSGSRPQSESTEGSVSTFSNMKKTVSSWYKYATVSVGISGSSIRKDIGGPWTLLFAFSLLHA